MARLTQIRRPDDFEDWNTLDWAFDREERPLNSQDIVSQRPKLYRVADGDLTINAVGEPVVRMRFCSDDDCVVNFRRSKALLFANDLSASIEPAIAPITLAFANPVRAVGAYVGAVFEPALEGQRLQAVMWVKPVGGKPWQPVNAVGAIAEVLADDAAESAAFVGASFKEGGGIEQICFDASVVGRFRYLALSALRWAA